MAPRDLTAVLLAVLGVYVLGHSITQVGTTAFFLTLDSSDPEAAAQHGAAAAVAQRAPFEVW